MFAPLTDEIIVPRRIQNYMQLPVRHTTPASTQFSGIKTRELYGAIMTDNLDDATHTISTGAALVKVTYMQINEHHTIYRSPTQTNDVFETCLIVTCATSKPCTIFGSFNDNGHYHATILPHTDTDTHKKTCDTFIATLHQYVPDIIVHTHARTPNSNSMVTCVIITDYSTKSGIATDDAENIGISDLIEIDKHARDTEDLLNKFTKFWGTPPAEITCRKILGMTTNVATNTDTAPECIINHDTLGIVLNFVPNHTSLATIIAWCTAEQHHQLIFSRPDTNHLIAINIVQ